MAPGARRRKAAALKAKRTCDVDAGTTSHGSGITHGRTSNTNLIASSSSASSVRVNGSLAMHPGSGTPLHHRQHLSHHHIDDLPAFMMHHAAAAHGMHIQEIDEDSDEEEEDDDDLDRMDHDEDDEDDDEDNLNCLHCQEPSTEVQVRCDECSSYICNNCHWCHEFQANHEVRVCDRCDAFYCRGCDEMDQCDDCAEVVCASCSTLLSCKFCGGGLCEECATACGRCGIVLCSRDAKFAVECDTCRLSYCLVCLASSSKDPCVRCGHRPSKRMEQLVHLRLKSIYKAFKQNSTTTAKSLNTRERQNDDPDEDHVADDPAALLHAAASAAKGGALANSKMPSQPRSGHGNSTSSVDKVSRFKEEKEKADAAAAALLAELEEEELADKKKNNKKKKKKAKQQAKSEDTLKSSQEQNAVTVAASSEAHDSVETASEVKSVDSGGSPDRRSLAVFNDSLAESKPTVVEEDPLEKEMSSLISMEDTDGLEKLLFSIKGVPGRALLRKNAKKALKRIRLEHCKVEEKHSEPSHESGPTHSRPSTPLGPCDPNGLLKIVSHLHNKPSAQDTAAGRVGVRARPTNAGGGIRSECVLHMSPNIVGWVIGKGGQRIRDLMEESGARIWIDQDSMHLNDPRIVYVSGHRKNVDHAVDSIKDLVSKAPTMSSPHLKQHTPTGEHFGHVARSTSIGKAPAIPVVSDKALTGNEASVLPLSSNRIGGDSRARQELTCDPRFVPLLIGRRGWTIKNIQDSTGAKVDIDQTVTPRKITVSGQEDNVEKAIRMVRDVLSYPQAQLQGLDSAHADPRIAKTVPQPNRPATPVSSGIPLSPAAAATAKPISSDFQLPSANVKAQPARADSPPSALIMTGDAKSTISPSSSLSSTPEPSMASSSRPTFTFAAPGPMLSPQNQQILHGPLIDMPHRNTSTYNQMAPQSPMASHPVHQQRSISNNNGFSAGDQYFSGIQQPSPGAHISPPFQQSSPVNQNRPVFIPTNSVGFGQMPHPSGSPMQVPRQRPFQTSKPNFPIPSHPSNFGNASDDTGRQGTALWNDHTIPQRNTLYNSQDFRHNAAVEFLEHSKQRKTVVSPLGAGMKNVIGLQDRVATEKPLAAQVNASFIQGRDDAQMVDSLFGPDDPIEGSSLLTGIQGLSINNDLPSNTDTLWGGGVSNTSNFPVGPRLNPFAHDGDRPFPTSQPQISTGERKPQSRFAWGEQGKG